MMSSMLPNDPNQPKKGKSEPFSEIIKSMNGFLNEKPVRGFLQSIDEFFKAPFPPGTSGTIPLKTIENADETIVIAELPGIKKEQIHLDILGNHLTISVENRRIDTEKDDINHVYQQKQFFQQSSRTISLPRPINEKKVKASYRDGLLQIRILHEKGKTISIEE